MEAFKITFKLKSPAVLPDALYLDSLISAAKCKDIMQSEYYSSVKSAGDIELIRATLDKIIAREYSVYKCSKIFFKESSANANYVKRFESKYEHLINTTKKIDTQRGYFKSAFNSLCYYTDTEPYAFCEGDIEEIIRLLTEHIFSIGKKSSQGYGAIESMEFEKIEAFPWVHNNELVRNIPAEYANEFDCEYDFAEIPLISPYWRKERELCIY